MINQTIYLKTASADEIIYMILSGKYSLDELKVKAEKYHKKWNDKY